MSSGKRDARLVFLRRRPGTNVVLVAMNNGDPHVWNRDGMGNYWKQEDVPKRRGR